MTPAEAATDALAAAIMRAAAALDIDHPQTIDSDGGDCQGPSSGEDHWTGAASMPGRARWNAKTDDEWADEHRRVCQGPDSGGPL